MTLNIEMAMFPLLLIPASLLPALIYTIALYLHTKNEKQKWMALGFFFSFCLSLGVYFHIDVKEFYFWSKPFTLGLATYIIMLIFTFFYKKNIYLFEKMLIIIFSIILIITLLLNSILSGIIINFYLIALALIFISISLKNNRPFLMHGVFLLLLGLFAFIGMFINYAGILLFSLTLLIALLYEFYLYFENIIELFRNVSMTAIRDPLTNLYNKQYLESKTEELFLSQNITVLFIDIDNFKTINDTKGHAFGDEVLKKISNLLMKEVNSFGFSCRYGGEELVAVLTAGAADRIAEKFRARVEKELNLTVSIGLANSSEIETNSYSDLLNLADQRMYHAKKTGKNKVVVAI